MLGPRRWPRAVVGQGKRSRLAEINAEKEDIRAYVSLGVGTVAVLNHAKDVTVGDDYVGERD